jgi:hypothetical protein
MVTVTGFFMTSSEDSNARDGSRTALLSHRQRRTLSARHGRPEERRDGWGDSPHIDHAEIAVARDGFAHYEK